MDYVRLGSAGMKVSRIALGCMNIGSKAWRDWALEGNEARALIRRALDAGINFFDTADYYSLGASERLLGAALKELGVTRDKVVISSKVGLPVGEDPNHRGLSRKHIRHSIDQSLARLGTGYIDVYQIHRFDPLTPVDEVLSALEDVVRAGKALYVGASSMYAWQFARLLGAAAHSGKIRFVSMQSHYNLVYREEEREMIPLCAAEGIAVLPWSPLARGVLAGRKEDTPRSRGDHTARRFYDHESDAAVIEALGGIAQRRSVPPAQIALAWLMHQPVVPAVVLGASRPSHIDDAVSAVSLRLDGDEIAALTAPYRAHPVIGHHA
jgi:aryl-alcohol dehydrogenase (NADP+)